MSSWKIMSLLTAAAFSAALLLASGAWADMIEIGSSNEESGAWTDPSGAVLTGSVWISHEGKLRVGWDGIALNAGSVRMSMRGMDPRIAATFPSFKLDLQKLLGREWMKAIELTIGTGSVSDDFGTGKAELQIGKISLSLAQTLHDGGGWSWTLRETASGSYMSSRALTGAAAVESVPVKLAIDSELVRHFTQEIAVTLSIGAYGTVVNSRSAPTWRPSSRSGTGSRSAGASRARSSWVAPAGSSRRRRS